jgi:hypothetical protein
MQLCFDFRIYFNEWVFKSRLRYKKKIAKSSYCFSLVDGNADKGPMSALMLGIFFLQVLNLHI